jgi:YARHG domain-containing protein
MKRIALILLFSVYSIFSYSQLDDLLGNWTNGFVGYQSSIYNDSIIIFEGADLHEGGYAFSIVNRPKTGMFIYGKHPDFMEYPSIGKVGDKVVFSIVQGEKNILVKNPNEKIVDFLIPLNEMTLEELKVLHKVNHELAGVYKDKATGEKITFLPHEKTVKGLIESQNHYSFGREFDSPVNVIIINEKAYYYERVENGLDIFISEKDEYGDWQKNEKQNTLEKIEWFNLSNNEKLNGKFQFASTQLLIDNVLYKYKPNQLKIMRNEIFARHGYIFKTNEMNEYFKSQDWYEPTGGNIGEKLSEIEKLNVKLIKRYEEENSKL